MAQHLNQQRQQQRHAAGHMLTGAVVVLLAQGHAQRQQRVFVGCPRRQGDHLWFAHLHQQVGCQHLGNAFQRVLGGGDHQALDLAGPMETMHHLRWYIDHAGCLHLEPVTVEQHFTAAALQVQQLQQAFMTVRGNFPVVCARPLGDLLHMQGFVPHRLCGFTVQGVVGDLVHVVVIVLFGTWLLCHSCLQASGGRAKIVGNVGLVAGFVHSAGVPAGPRLWPR
ncbi:hypothetical protein D3C80_1058170 [compost metagenome]